MKRDDPKKAFITAWNNLIENRELYESEWMSTIEGLETLRIYRIKELKRLVEEVGFIEDLPYELMIQTLSQIEVDIDGQVRVIFLSGTEVVVTTP